VARVRKLHLPLQARSAALALAVCAAGCATTAPLATAAAATQGVLTVAQVRALFSAHGITLDASTFTKAKTRFVFPASLTKNVVVLVPSAGRAQGLSDLVVLVWTHPSKAQQASATWVRALQDRNGWFAVDYNVVWSSTHQSEVGSPILHAITNRIIVDECIAGGRSAADCGKLVA
jgi:hypothetical protein